LHKIQRIDIGIASRHGALQHWHVRQQCGLSSIAQSCWDVRAGSALIDSKMVLRSAGSHTSEAYRAARPMSVFATSSWRFASTALKNGQARYISRSRDRSSGWV
jgi:hypothetical protein